MPVTDLGRQKCDDRTTRRLAAVASADTKGVR